MMYSKSMSQLIVTGANGFFGSNLVDQLLDLGHQVHGLFQNDNHWSLEDHGPNLKLSKVDITDKNQLAEFFDKFANPKTIVIHSAGLVSIASNIEPILKKVNVDGTKNVITACQKAKIKRLVYISSVHAIPELPKGQTMSEVEKFDPDLVVGGYAKTKAIATQLAVDARKTGLDVVVIHPSGMIGPGDWGKGNIKQAIIDYTKRQLTAITRGGYDFADVRDVAEATIKASLLDTAKNQHYIFSDRYFSLREIIDLVDKARPNHKRHLNMLPHWFLKIAASLAEVWYKLRRVAPTFTRYSVYTLTSNANYSHDKAARELNYQPRPMEETIRDTLNWYEKVGFISDDSRR